MASDDNQQTYPGVQTAYDFVLPSYNWMVTRLESADNRLQSLHVFVVSVTFGLLSVVKTMNPSISFTSGRFIIAMFFFAALTVIGSIARLKGGVMLVNPGKLETSLHLDTWTFRRQAIYFAAGHFAVNAEQVQKKATAAFVMTSLFLVELLFLLAWTVTA